MQPGYYTFSVNCTDANGEKIQQVEEMVIEPSLQFFQTYTEPCNILGDADNDCDVDLDDLKAVLDNLTVALTDNVVLRIIGMWAAS